LAQQSSPDTLAGPSTSVRLTGDRDLARRLPLFDVCGLIALAGLVTAIAFRQSDILALTTPFVVVVAAALALWRPVDGVVQIRADRTRIVEGEDVTILVDITSARGIDRVEIELEPSARLLAVGSLRAVTTVKPNSTATLAFTVRAGEWGIARIDKLTIRVSDRFAMFGGELDTRADTTITIGLPEDRISASLEAERFRSIVGSHLSNDRGQGMEIADIRPFQPGDSTRNINWRISNRRQEPWVTLRHPDRSTTVVVIVDAHDPSALRWRSVAAIWRCTIVSDCSWWATPCSGCRPSSDETSCSRSLTISSLSATLQKRVGACTGHLLSQPFRTMPSWWPCHHCETH
jgi:uncharacterized protein (DUF58 family)